jgi:hypothetical protein
MEKGKKKCCCKANIIKVDNHIICERYYLEIKQGIKEQQKIIEELTGGEII